MRRDVEDYISSKVRQKTVQSAFFNARFGKIGDMRPDDYVEYAEGNGSNKDPWRTVFNIAVILFGGFDERKK
jgi:hypothetical protein